MKLLVRTLIVLWTLFALIPVMAQRPESTYVTDTGTSIEYPADWQVEEDQGLIVLSETTNRRVIVVDYPIVADVLDGMMDNALRNAVAILARQILDDEIDRDTIYEFEAGGRSAAGYDLLSTQLPGNIFAIEFSNGAIGMLVVVNVDDDTAYSMLSTFDNDAPLSTGRPATMNRNARVFLFDSQSRFSVPAGWSLQLRRVRDLEYADLTMGDNGRVRVFDLSDHVPNALSLADVLIAHDLDFQRALDLRIKGDGQAYNIGTREALRYPVTVDGETGIAFVIRYSNRGIGAVIVTGDATVFENDLDLILGSFNYLGAALDYID